MSKLKAEFLQHWYDIHGIPFRTKLITSFGTIFRLASYLPGIYNMFANGILTGHLIRKIAGFAKDRSLPNIKRQSAMRWARKHLKSLNDELPDDAPQVNYFVDEFTDYTDANIGISTMKLLNRLGIRVFVYRPSESGRSHLSKGLVRAARQHAIKNLNVLKGHVTEYRPLVGTEPSAILAFRDEYPELVTEDLVKTAKQIAELTYTIDEYICSLLDKGIIEKSSFTTEKRQVRLHGHCQQKALIGTKETIRMLSIPKNYTVSEIPSGCCGMAGSFGYEKEHYQISMKVGELVLFPAVRSLGPKTILAVPGTSCRHQVKDGTGVLGKHPVEILLEALI